MGCGSTNQKRTSLIIIIDSPPPSLPSSMHIIDLPTNQTFNLGAKLQQFEKSNLALMLSSQPTNEEKDQQKH
ncbi:unnamed protein product [Paramecium primaurelia]|uniref:Uncharacterized protein n=1 Tax=Paramecium primaurelia TaxID=5886 RepID=A0A8S1MKE9_PARPR|nr:unnamed protein product [Paramecium primaurelia]